ncbi:histidine-rich glycoprotein isoform X2 [Rhinichthys klamathensis goyatoka]|uniref:histidine-rich glycoprotein isoform X2 n=1 Tax=Rhinichthys klamathensis goyatoka TaxID=3034132 RepID=UPI0024B5090F|nr:histidine-rich glycoprotein isoform X2 [Rhinichthys klamathensis goyatoka]
MLSSSCGVHVLPEARGQRNTVKHLTLALESGFGSKMEAEAEQVEETTEVMEATETPSQEEPSSDNKFRGRGMKFRGRGGRMGRGIRGGRGMMMMMKGFRPPGHMRGRGRDGFTNGFGPMRRGMGRTWPYPDMRGRRGRGGPMGMNLGPPPPPPHHMHMRGPPPHMHRHGPPPPPPPPGHPAFRGRPPHPRGRSMMPPGPPRFFHPRGGETPFWKHPDTRLRTIPSVTHLLQAPPPR